MQPTDVDPNAPVYAQPNPQPLPAAKPAEPPPPPPKAVPPKELMTPEAQEAKRALEKPDEEAGPRPLSKVIKDALSIPDEEAFQVYASAASKEHPDFRSRYEAYCKATYGYVLFRLQNLQDGNPWRLPAGPDSCRPPALEKIPDGLQQPDIAMLNCGAPLEVVRPQGKASQKALTAAAPTPTAPRVHDHEEKGKK